MYKRYWTTISVEIYVELYCSSTRGDCNMICWFKQEECSHLMPASLVYSKSVIECLLHCLLNIPRNIGDAFSYVITCVYTSWKTVVLLFLFHVLHCNAIFANQDLLPTLRPGNFDLHTKMPGSAPAWAVYTNVQFVSIYFSSAGGVNASAGVLFMIISHVKIIAFQTILIYCLWTVCVMDISC